MSIAPLVATKLRASIMRSDVVAGRITGRRGTCNVKFNVQGTGLFSASTVVSMN